MCYRKNKIKENKFLLSSTSGVNYNFNRYIILLEEFIVRFHS